MEESCKDYDSPDEVLKRASQEDPIVMYLIVRESLNMSPGKIGAQCAHAAQMLMILYNQTVSEHLCGWNVTFNKSIFEEWLESSFRKVVLKADEKEWLKIKTECKDEMVLVIDAGLTEIPSGSETVIGLWPRHRGGNSKLLKRLQVLK
ncbi:pth2 Peptidyl-tRNA hydrolase [uncultured Caudovirales phage]|uniref:peptidyl-tRNA hydrolase n=1 Tax=uncultured Caudovirales phage TaxID=2100421 RepID=A0A6J5RXX9_9CAUD|nr:pth2 Peptidyl-tRNA hydrolase [uncultured Caudovirales phage]